MPSVEEIRAQAEMLARDNREAEPTIERVYWFPSDREIWLVELTPVVPSSLEFGKVQPFYFRADPGAGIIAPSGIAMIRPDEFKRLDLPKGWPSWEEAVELPAHNGNGHV